MTLRELINEVGEDKLDFTLQFSYSYYSDCEFGREYETENVTDYDIGYSDKIIQLS